MGATLLDQPGRALTEADIASAGDIRYNRGRGNYIINGAMMVSQENGTTAGTTTGYYPVDMFNIYFSNGGTTSVAQVASVTPGGSPNRIRVTATAADASVAAGDYSYLRATVEGLQCADLLFGTASAKTITIRFGVKAPAGTYCVTVRNSAANRSYVSEYTISGGEANTDVVKSVTIAGDTSGTWLTTNGIGLDVRWALMVGTTYQQTAGSWSTGNVIGSSSQFNFMGTISNVFELFDVSLTQGTVAPTFSVPNFATELSLCQRYWEKSYDYSSAPGSTGSGLTGAEAHFYDGVSSATHQMGYKVRYTLPKRATPTVTTYSYTTGTSGKITDAVAGADITSTVDSVGITGFRAYSTSTGASTSVSRYFHWKADARL